jgi:hypothetical protein
MIFTNFLSLLCFHLKSLAGVEIVFWDLQYQSMINIYVYVTEIVYDTSSI